MGWGYKSGDIPSPSHSLLDSLTEQTKLHTENPLSKPAQQELSEIMDMMTAAKTLRNELIAYAISETNLKMIDQEMNRLGEQCLLTSMGDNQSKHLPLLLRLSVTDGVQQMYRLYREKKWAQVQSTAQQIKASLEADDNEMMTSPVTSSPTGGNTRPDQAMDHWTTVFCKLSRHE